MVSFLFWCHPVLWVVIHDSCITANKQVLQKRSTSDTIYWVSHMAQIVDASISSFFRIFIERLKAHALLILFLSSSVINRFSFMDGNGGTGRALFTYSDSCFPANTPSSPVVRNSCFIGPNFKFCAVVSSSNILFSCFKFSRLWVRFFSIFFKIHCNRVFHRWVLTLVLPSCIFQFYHFPDQQYQRVLKHISSPRLWE